MTVTASPGSGLPAQTPLSIAAGTSTFNLNFFPFPGFSLSQFTLFFETTLPNGDICTTSLLVPITDWCDGPDEPEARGTTAPLQAETGAFSIAPNPASSYTELSTTDSPAGSLVVEVYDYTGKLVFREPLADPSHPFRLELGQLARGVYLVALRQDGNVTDAKRLLLK